MPLLVMRQLPSPLAKAIGIDAQPAPCRISATSVRPSPLKSPVKGCTLFVAAQPAKSPIPPLVMRQPVDEFTVLAMKSLIAGLLTRV